MSFHFYFPNLPFFSSLCILSTFSISFFFFSVPFNYRNSCLPFLYYCLLSYLSTIFFLTVPHFVQGFPLQPFLLRRTPRAVSGVAEATRLKYSLPKGPGICQLQDALEKMFSYDLVSASKMPRELKACFVGSLKYR